MHHDLLPKITGEKKKHDKTKTKIAQKSTKLFELPQTT
jgi:hypothetical protein